jgi:hypothetical protein
LFTWIMRIVWKRWHKSPTWNLNSFSIHLIPYDWASAISGFLECSGTRWRTYHFALPKGMRALEEHVGFEDLQSVFFNLMECHQYDLKNNSFADVW